MFEFSLRRRDWFPSCTVHQSIWSGSLIDVFIIPACIIPACIILNGHVALTWAAPGLENASPLLFIKGQNTTMAISTPQALVLGIQPTLCNDNSPPKLQVIGLIILNESSHPKAKSTTLAAHLLMAELSNSNRDKSRLRPWANIWEVISKFPGLSSHSVGLGYLVAKSMVKDFRFPILTPSILGWAVNSALLINTGGIFSLCSEVWAQGCLQNVQNHTRFWAWGRSDGWDYGCADSVCAFVCFYMIRLLLYVFMTIW